LSDEQPSVATRSKLVNKNVYNPNGILVGTVQDVVLPLGEGEISLQILTRSGGVEVVAWSNISAVGDIVLLKKAIGLKEPTAEIPRPLPSLTPKPPEHRRLIPRFGKKSEKCPTCGGELRWLKQYQRWYCPNEHKYA
jgi:sporulation protein YlmC with PRC-barrel domain